MPIDPNEPLYCYCQQVSYGEMVACDNGDVSSNMDVVFVRLVMNGESESIQGVNCFSFSSLFNLSARSSGFICLVLASRHHQEESGTARIVLKNPRSLRKSKTETNVCEHSPSVHCNKQHISNTDLSSLENQRY